MSCRQIAPKYICDKCKEENGVCLGECRYAGMYNDKVSAISRAVQYKSWIDGGETVGLKVPQDILSSVPSE